MKCPRCNKIIDNDSKFCEYCGSTIKGTYDINANNKIKNLKLTVVLLLLLQLINKFCYNNWALDVITLFWYLIVLYFFFYREDILNKRTDIFLPISVIYIVLHIFVIIYSFF